MYKLQEAELPIMCFDKIICFDRIAPQSRKSELGKAY